MNISDEAVEAAARAMAHLFDYQTEAGKSHWRDKARRTLEAAAPILLSHERQQTADAHRDAIVNRDTADRVEQELRQAKAEAWDEGEHAGYLNRGAEEFGLRRPNPYRAAGAGE